MTTTSFGCHSYKCVYCTSIYIYINLHSSVFNSSIWSSVDSPIHCLVFIPFFCIYIVWSSFHSVCLFQNVTTMTQKMFHLTNKTSMVDKENSYCSRNDSAGLVIGWWTPNGTNQSLTFEFERVILWLCLGVVKYNYTQK